ncbi:MAG: hypothetical protein KDA79_15355, partial [Planctomycetaceae bacterium]|nr:hypothetical protein [Planctomycetaceae bacterium]
QKVAEGLKEASRQVDAALRKLAAEQTEELARQAERSDALARKTAKVDPAATSAVRDAQDAADAGADASRQLAELTPQAEETGTQPNKPGEAKPGDAKPGDAKPGEDSAKPEAGEAKPGDPAEGTPQTANADGKTPRGTPAAPMTEAQAEQASAPLKRAAEAEAGIRRNLERAEANLAARQQEVQRDRAVAEALARLAAEQQAAAEEIGRQRDRLDQIEQAAADEADTPMPADAAPGETEKGTPKPAAKPARSNPERDIAARKLAEAAREFARTQRATGQGAVEVSRQQEVASQPIREGLELASALPAAALPEPVPAAEEAAAGEPAGENQPNAGDSPAEGDAAGNSDEAAAEAGSPQAGEKGDSPANGKPAAGKPAGSKPAGGKPGNGQPAGQATASKEMGTGLVPQSPEVTAQAMAGPQAAEEVQAALADLSEIPGEALAAATGELPEGEAAGQQQAQQAGSQPATGKPAQSTPSQASGSSESTASSSGEGTEAENDSLKKDPLKFDPADGEQKAAKPGAGGAESQTVARRFRNEAWFARLPAELRSSIRAGAGRRPPRAYEERLRRYFESVEDAAPQR